MKTLLSVVALATLPGPIVLGQGPLEPAGPPGPTQHSLEEIWNRIGGLEETVQLQQEQLLLLRRHNAALLEASGAVIPWRVTTVASGAGNHVSLAFDPGGWPAIAYHHPAAQELRIASAGAGGWTVDTIDTDGDVGKHCSLAFSPPGTPAIAYFDEGDDDLMFASPDGTAWSTTPVETAGDVGRDCDLAFTPAGRPAIAYVDTGDAELHYAEWDGATWQLAVVAPLDTSGGQPSLAFSPDGTPAIAYQDGEYHVDGPIIHYATRSSMTWSSAPVEPASPDPGDEYKSPSLAFSAAGEPAIAMDHYLFNGAMKFAIRQSGSWQFSTFHGAGDWGFEPSLAFSPLGTPTVAFNYFPDDPTQVPVGFASRDGGSWNVEPVETLDVSLPGLSCSHAYSPAGEAAAAYSVGGELRFAIRTPFASP